MISHYGWVKLGKSWKLVATGTSENDAYRELLRWVRAQAQPPASSAVLPVGARPEMQGGAGGPGATGGRERAPG
jgi:hypothetical protein